MDLYHPLPAARIASSLVAAALLAAPLHANRPYTSEGAVITESFDSLAASPLPTAAYPNSPLVAGAPAWSNGSTALGWHFTTDTGTTPANYLPSTGAFTAQNIALSAGSADNTDRALGSQSASLTATPSRLGWRIRNNSGITLHQFTLSYTGEQWRAVQYDLADGYSFDWQVFPANAGSISAPSGWTAAPSLNFTSPQTTTTASSAINGNAPANRITITATIEGIHFQPGTDLWLRWSDLPNTIAGTNNRRQLIALDDVSFSASSTLPAELPGMVFSEFLAGNDSSIEDEDTDNSDWIELFNGQTFPQDLSGWRLTDDPTHATSWPLPPATLGAQQRRIVFASGKNRSTPQWHTNFSLSKEAGGYLALLRPDGSVARSIQYARQYDDISFGWSGPSQSSGYFSALSPALPNPESPLAEPLPDPVFSLPSGVVSSSVSVTISLPADAPSDISLRYTTDLSEPSESSPLYLKDSPAIVFPNGGTLRARAFRPGHLPSRIGNRHFIRLGSSIASDYRSSGKPFQSNLPVLLLDSFGIRVDSFTATNARPDRTTFAALYPAAAPLNSAPQKLLRGATRVRGQTSAAFPQKPYQWELWSSSKDDDNSEPLLDLPSGSDWILQAPYSDKSLMRNIVAFDTMRDWAGPGSAMRSRFVEVFFNQNGGALDWSDYRGVYILTENVERGKDRVPLQKLNSLIEDPVGITGGYMWSKDKGPFDNLINTLSPNSWGPQKLDVIEPKSPTQAQINYITSHINSFESSLAGTSFTNPSSGYAAFIDSASFIDRILWIELFRQADFQSMYYAKDRGGKIRAVPLWDFNMSSGNTNDWSPLVTQQPGQSPSEGWMNVRFLHDWQSRFGASFYPYFPRLFADPEFTTQFWDRYWQVRRTIGSDSAISQRIDSLAAQLTVGLQDPVTNGVGAWPATSPSSESPVARHYARWPILGTLQWPNSFGATDRTTFASEISFFKSWLLRRLAWMDSQSMTTPNVTPTQPASAAALPPVLSPASGMVAPQSQLSFLNDNPDAAQLFYTINGPDPRSPGGTTHPAALTATAASLTSTDLIPGGSAWSFLAPSAAPPATWTTPDFDASSWSQVSSITENTVHTGTTYFRRAFTASAADLQAQLRFDLKVDDGCAIYLNGTEIARYGLPLAPTPVTFSTPANALIAKGHEGEVISFSLPGNLLRQGSNLLAVEVHQYGYSLAAAAGITYATGLVASDTDLSFDLRLRSLTRVQGTPITLGASGAHVVRSRFRIGNTWSPLTESSFSVGAVTPSAQSLVVSEIHYHPADPSPSEIAAGFNSASAFEFIELTNTGTQPLDLSSTYLADAVSFRFSSAQPSARFIAPGARLVIVGNLSAFLSRHPTAAPSVAGVFSGSLSNSGETLTVRRTNDDGSNSILISISYSDSFPWPSEADGDGYSMVFIQSASSDPSNGNFWRPSLALHGCPGASDSIPWNGELPVIQIDHSGTVRVSQPAATDTVSYILEVSDDLIHWGPASSMSAELTDRKFQPATSTIEESWGFPAGTAPARCFFRKRIQLR
jgi:hypothetical protein